VVPKGDDVGARGEDFVRELRSDPHAVGSVLAVHDAEAGAELLLERGQPSLERPPARRAEDVCDEEDDQLRL
jgi:hypothetical protein